MMRCSVVSAAICLAAVASSAIAYAEPAKIIILRHGEKKNGRELCDVGLRRAQALAAQFLGRNATPSLVPPEGPAAILAITLHTIETIAPAARTWNSPVKASPVPRGEKGEEKDDDLDRSTRDAAQQVLTDPAYAGKTVIMVWEHKRIASKEHNAGLTSLRALLHLDQAAMPPPETWEGENYNFFWIVDYPPGQQVTVTTRRQAFTGAFADLPDNDWGKPEHHTGDCE